ncbi:CapA family protein [Sporotomaculum syntrophicum]|uniref:CapA family protein n=1 Tax=Sporotomaculum syntrophicum TaxID=182264 RepID=UPI00137A30B4|nr:CapA family protein [Sporotomaculum syntrophicum]
MLLILLPAVGLLYCSCACTPQQHAGSGNFHDMAAFNEYRMQLPEKHEPLCLVAVGDIMLSRYVAQKINEHNDPNYPFAGVKWFLQDGDIVFGNLEGPLTPGREIKIPEMVLRTDPCMAAALKDAGFNILSLANNHVPDFGEQGIQDTMCYLDSTAIYYAGAGNNEQEAFAPRYMKVKGVKLAFLAFNDLTFVPDSYMADDGPGTAVLKPEKVAAAVREAADNADFTVVYLHAGIEYASKPDDTQVYFAHLAIDAGADLVLGSHPHVVQKIEQYQGKYILYSLGNFIFDQLWSRDTREGIVARIFISENSVEMIEFLPVYINDNARPVALSGQEAQRVLEKLGLQLDMQTVPAWDNEKMTFTAAEQYIFQAGKSLPEYRLVQSRQFDMDGDGILEEFSLRNGRITVRSASRTLWQSPNDWWVDYFFLGDANNDGLPEFSLLVWKEGSFGPHRPFWLEEDDTGIKNHLFIFKLEKGAVKPVWQSSNLDHPNYRAALTDLNDDDKNELVVTEGSYTDPARREVTLWEWNGWGFSRITLDSESGI